MTYYLVLSKFANEVSNLSTKTSGLFNNLPIALILLHLSNPKNYRGIMLLEIAYSIIAIIPHVRLLLIEESVDHKSQCGLRAGKGCHFFDQMALKKRREQSLESCVLILDLAKAFDHKQRIFFWKILPKFGVPNKLMSLLKVLHANFVVRFTIDDVTQSLDCIISVKQGDILGVILFTFFIAAMMITWRASCNIPVCMFCSKMDATLADCS